MLGCNQCIVAVKLFCGQNDVAVARNWTFFLFFKHMVLFFRKGKSSAVDICIYLEFAEGGPTWDCPHLCRLECANRFGAFLWGAPLLLCCGASGRAPAPPLVVESRVRLSAHVDAGPIAPTDPGDWRFVNICDFGCVGGLV